MADLVKLVGPVSVANLTAAAGALTGDDGFWWPCLNITFRTPVPASITKITAQVRERGADGRYSQPAEQVLTADELAAGEAKIVNGVSVGQHLQVRLNPEGAPGLPFQATPWVDVTTPWDAIMTDIDGLTLGCVKIVCGVGVPTRTDLPTGSIYVREDVVDLYQYVAAVPPIVQSQIKVSAVDSWSLTLDAAPTEGNVLIAVASVNRTPGGYTPGAASGWTTIATYIPSGSEGHWRLVYKVVGAAESATQTAFTGGTGSGANIIHGMWEVSDLDPDDLVISYQTNHTSGGSPTSLTIANYTTTVANTLALVAMMGEKQAASTAAATLSAGWTTDKTVTGGSVDYFPNMNMGHQLVAEVGDTVGGSGSWAAAQTGVNYVAAFLRPRLEWRPLSYMRTIKSDGTTLTTAARSIDFTGGTVAVDDAGNVSVDLASITDEQVRDVIAAALVAGDGIAITPDDGADTITIEATTGALDALKLGHGVFVSAAHENTSHAINTFISLDGVEWSPFGDSPAFATAARDPALLHYDGKWWLACTDVAVAPHWFLFSSDDLLTWSGPSNIDTSAAGGTYTWAPQWYVDRDGSVHVFVSIGTTTKAIYEMHPTSRDMSTWSAPALVLSGANSYIDPFVQRVGDTYFMFFKDDTTGYICLASSSSLTSGYSVTQTGNWAGWRTGLPNTIEAPTIVQMDDGRWRIYFTNNNGLTANAIYYSDTTDSTFASGWSAAAALSDFSGYNHPVPLRIPGGFDVWNRVWEMLGRDSGIATLDGSGQLPVSQLPALAASDIANGSGVSGATVEDALNALLAAIPTAASDLANDSGVTGATVEDALNTLLAALASAGQVYAPLTNGTTPGPVLMADSLGQCIMAPIT